MSKKLFSPFPWKKLSVWNQSDATRALKLTFLSFFLSFHPFNFHQSMTHAPISSLSFEYNPRKNELEVEQAGKDTLFPLSNAFCETQTYTHLHYLYLSGYLPLSFSLSISLTLYLSLTHTHNHIHKKRQKIIWQFFPPVVSWIKTIQHTL